MKLSLCMIAGNCADSIRDTIESVKDFMDEICIVVTKNDDERTLDTCKELATVCEYRPDFIDNETGEMRDFSVARNRSFELATGDWIFWLDSDDVFIGAQGFRHRLESLDSMGIDGVQVDYDYEHDANWNCTTRHRRERAFRRGYWKWIAPLHEVTSPTRMVNVVNIERDLCYVRHNYVYSLEKSLAKSTRNERILRKLVESGKADARMRKYYANALVDLGRLDEAVKYYGEYLQESDWTAEKYEVMNRLYNLYFNTGNIERARAVALKMLDMIPQVDEAHLLLAKIYAFEKKWDKVIFWCKLAMENDETDPVIVRNPMMKPSITATLLSEAFMQTGRFKEAAFYYKQLMELYPENKNLRKETIDWLDNQAQDMKLYENVKELASYVKEEDKELLYKIAPERIRDFPEFKKYCPKNRPGSKRVCAIYCGHDPVQAWGPDSIYHGIGGSEEAVINISQELVRLGWTVEVYANVTQEGEFNGVNWYQAAAANPDDIVDLSISWRSPGFVFYAPKGTVTWLWLHDFQYGQEPYYKDSLDRFDKVLFLSKFHRTTAPWVPEDKVFYTSNGMSPLLMKDGPNEQHKVVYLSAPDRGLENLLKIWEDVKKEAPEATLKIFYGFNKWFDDKYRNNKAMMDFKAWVLETAGRLPGVQWVGNVGQDILAKEISEAGVWAYPATFEEISCISAMKAQCGGAIPVVTNNAALKETVQHGVKVDYDPKSEPHFDLEHYKGELVSMLKDGERQKGIRKEMIRDSRNKFCWKDVARKWHNQFIENCNKTISTTGVI